MKVFREMLCFLGDGNGRAINDNEATAEFSSFAVRGRQTKARKRSCPCPFVSLIKCKESIVQMPT